MIQLHSINAPPGAGPWLASRFPWRLGRGSANDVQLQGDGVWDRHLEIHLRYPEGFELVAVADALVTVNDQSTGRVVLRNGDVIGVGAFQLRFGLSPTRLRGVAWREWLTWLSFAVLCLGQIALIYLLPG